MTVNHCKHIPGAGPGFKRLASGGLPVHLWKGRGYAVFYVPCFACLVPAGHADATVDRINRLLDSMQAGVQASPEDASLASAAAARIVRAAMNAAEEAARTQAGPFSPECLTLFLNNACQLQCIYCHAVPDAHPEMRVSGDAVRMAAALVARSCAEKGGPFTLALHGGGEPAMDRRQADRFLAIAREEAVKHGVDFRTYIATNGVMSRDSARWLAAGFDLVGLSCDGPPDVQDRQRPLRGGGPTSGCIKQTAKILRDMAAPFHVRATVSRETLARQAEVAAFFMDAYGPDEVRLEPVYENPSGQPGLDASQAGLFVSAFMEARKLGDERGIPVTTSLTRPGALHGRHCNVLRHVLNLVPGDMATGCFLESREAGMAARQVKTGAMNAGARCFDLDMAHIENLIRRCTVVPAGCRSCLCALQCTYGCPDVCVLQHQDDAADPVKPGNGFRCRSNRLLMEALILEAAERAWQDAGQDDGPSLRRDWLDAALDLPMAVFKEEGPS